MRREFQDILSKVALEDFEMDDENRRLTGSEPEHHNIFVFQQDNIDSEALRISHHLAYGTHCVSESGRKLMAKALERIRDNSSINALSDNVAA